MNEKKKRKQNKPKCLSIIPVYEYSAVHDGKFGTKS